MVFYEHLDMTNVVTRGFYQGLYSVPQLINLFVPSIVAQSLIDREQWRWAYGHLPLVLLVANLPLLYGLWSVQGKIFKEGLYRDYKKTRREQDNHRSVLDSIKFYLSVIDFVGCILLIGALAMTLLPLVLALYTWGGWGNCRFFFFYNFYVLHYPFYVLYTGIYLLILTPNWTLI